MQYPLYIKPLIIILSILSPVQTETIPQHLKEVETLTKKAKSELELSLASKIVELYSRGGVPRKTIELFIKLFKPKEIKKIPL